VVDWMLYRNEPKTRINIWINHLQDGTQHYTSKV
jgi:hypothetical protein